MKRRKSNGKRKRWLDRPFEHEARLKELLSKQAELNPALDLDKNERQVAPDDGQCQKEAAPNTFVERVATQRASELTI